LGPNLVGKSSVPVWHEASGQRCRGKKSGIEPNRYGDPKSCDGLTGNQGSAHEGRGPGTASFAPVPAAGCRSGRSPGSLFSSIFWKFRSSSLACSEAGSLREAEQECLLSASLESNGTTWSSLGALYHRQGRLLEEIDAWERASALLPYPAPELLALGYAELAAHRPQRALQAFDGAVTSLPPRRERGGSQRFSVSLARGRAMGRSALDQQR
jgi:hypothetical protein